MTLLAARRLTCPFYFPLHAQNQQAPVRRASEGDERGEWEGCRIDGVRPRGDEREEWESWRMDREGVSAPPTPPGPIGPLVGPLTFRISEPNRNPGGPPVWLTFAGEGKSTFFAKKRGPQADFGPIFDRFWLILSRSPNV